MLTEFCTYLCPVMPSIARRVGYVRYVVLIVDRMIHGRMRPLWDKVSLLIADLFLTTPRLRDAMKNCLVPND
jgi:hypothetical protein